MVKVEAVVIRERVETVIDAVEDETGHVGVTVVEAIGHGRESLPGSSTVTARVQPICSAISTSAGSRSKSAL